MSGIRIPSVFLSSLFYRYGEIVPLGSNYLASYAAGVRTGIRELGPKLIGQDPTQESYLTNYQILS